MRQPSDIQLPSLREVTQLVRESNEYWDGGEFATLSFDEERCQDESGRAHWNVAPVSDHYEHQFGREWLPGDDGKVDATAVARRLLAAARDEGWR